MYINSQFAPSPNERIADLYDVLFLKMIIVVFLSAEHVNCELCLTRGMGLT